MSGCMGTDEGYLKDIWTKIVKKKYWLYDAV